MGVGTKPWLVLLVPTWNLTERLEIRGLLKLSVLLLVTWNTLWIRLTLAILLDIGRLIRRCAPILRNETWLLRVMRNLYAFVLMQFVLTRTVPDDAQSALCRLLARNGVGVLLMSPRRWCRSE